MNSPVRLQLSRRRGFDLQALSLATNGLPARSVARPGIFGNPFMVGQPCGVFPEGMGHQGRAEVMISVLTLDHSLNFYDDLIRGMLSPEMYPSGHQWMERFNRVVTGHPLEYARAIFAQTNLACWCALPAPGADDRCHAAVLLRAINPQAKVA